jgi:hypothetical protein
VIYKTATPTASVRVCLITNVIVMEATPTSAHTRQTNHFRYFVLLIVHPSFEWFDSC